MNYICESCGSDLKYYDKVSRMVRTKNRKASIITVKRFKCPVCNCIHRNLPNNIFPYKQYDARIITGVIEGKITSDMIDYEDYPCEMTMTRVDQSDPDSEPYLFLELDQGGMNDIYKKQSVRLRVKIKNYISHK